MFHTTGNAEVIPLVAASNLRPSNCAQCKKGKGCTDPGWFVRLLPWQSLHLSSTSGACHRFGDHTKGIYVSKHADYTFW